MPHNRLSIYSLIALILIFCTTFMCTKAKVIVPKPLKEGSRIALVTPASAINDSTVLIACEKLIAMGYEPIVYPHALGKDYGSYPTTDENRAADLMKAFADPEIDAILCTRGGYGAVRLLPMLDADVVRKNPKWLVGYSDISVLHAFMQKAGVASIHGPMTGHLASEPDSLQATLLLFDVLRGKKSVTFELGANPYNHTGEAKGRLVGGNLITFNALSGTDYDVLSDVDDQPLILFIEDVGEEIYAIERIIMRLQYSGALPKLKGLIIGQFTGYKPSDDFDTMEDMIYHWLHKWGYYDAGSKMPIVFDYPTGHVSDNYPMIVSGEAILKVTPEGSTLTYTGK